jgi:hypothetical protein
VSTYSPVSVELLRGSSKGRSHYVCKR